MTDYCYGHPFKQISTSYSVVNDEYLCADASFSACIRLALCDALTSSSSCFVEASSAYREIAVHLTAVNEVGSQNDSLHPLNIGSFPYLHGHIYVVSVVTEPYTIATLFGISFT